ncbi:hypothetical protein F7018_06065 [Tenacibaculum aiptasiae]|uniref:Uncharacterized protein n=1 Tax=Tenacibaculum aiptasiae TaxID=426481 RepID=A0A7J5AQH9_9FLAO|nr:hypothetical protein [Tenacibaculum aiptasiae]KAB1159875.1 hypothetical protein F7018_06065 [Tenacibaculum aiptasiae]
MGENKHIEELDAFAKKYIQEIEEEQPSLDFTSNLMNILAKEENVALYKATPLISKKAWGILLSILTISIFYVSKGASLSWVKMPKIKFDYFTKFQNFNFLEGITISNTVLYTCFFFTLMIFVQIYYLKNHFTRNLNM